MKLQILSDTHNSKYSISEQADVIIHAGDFSNRLSGTIEFAEKCKSLNKKFIFVLGNHDYYSSKALLHKDLKCKAPLIEPNLRRNLGKWST